MYPSPVPDLTHSCAKDQGLIPCLFQSRLRTAQIAAEIFRALPGSNNPLCQPSAGVGVQSIDLLWGLGNLTALAAGPFTSRFLSSGKQVIESVSDSLPLHDLHAPHLTASSLLMCEILKYIFLSHNPLQVFVVGEMECFKDQKATFEFAKAVSELLPRALKQAEHLKATLARGGIESCGGAPSSSASSSRTANATVSSALAAVQQLWPFGQRLFLMRLFDGLEGTLGGIELFSLMCDTAMRCLPEISKALREASGGSDKAQGEVAHIIWGQVGLGHLIPILTDPAHCF